MKLLKSFGLILFALLVVLPGYFLGTNDTSKIVLEKAQADTAGPLLPPGGGDPGGCEASGGGACT